VILKQKVYKDDFAYKIVQLEVGVSTIGLGNVRQASSELE
jgi:hypothetical protein